MFQKLFRFDDGERENLFQKIPRQTFRLLTVLLTTAFIMAVGSESDLSNVHAEQNTFVKVFVHITRVEAHDKTDNNSEADLYSEVFQNGNRIGKKLAQKDQNFVAVDWWFQGPSHNASRNAPIKITLREADNNDEDEHIDISPVLGQTELRLVVTPFTASGKHCGLRVDPDPTLGRSFVRYDHEGKWVQRGNLAPICEIPDLNSWGQGIKNKNPGFIQYSIVVVRM